MKTTSTIGEIVAADYRAASVLDNYGVDYCNAGNKTLNQVCEEEHLDKASLENALADLSGNPGHQDPHWNYSEWDTRFLIEFIVHAHHQYIRETIPVLIRTGAKAAQQRGLNKSTVQEILRLSQALADDIETHLDVEETVIFPYILNLETALKDNAACIAPEFGRVESPIRKIAQQHAQASGLLKEIRALTTDYKIPAHASAELHAWYSLLKEFDADLHLHIHLENNILFPRAVALESELLDRKGYTTIWFG
ncbi:MAG: DUF542 domain-containing protein [Saprospiraceae bacterium]|nr:DUF542 domain-containing protein [Saprospiraceae bacterium]